jgi:hypothetical protein
MESKIETAGQVRRDIVRFAPVLTAICLAALAFTGAAAVHAQDLKSFEQKTTTKVLPNGLIIIIC